MNEPRSPGRRRGAGGSATVRFLSAQIDAGAEAVTLFDTGAGILPPTQFRRHVINPAPLPRLFGGIVPWFPIIGCLWPSARCRPNLVQIVR